MVKCKLKKRFGHHGITGIVSLLGLGNDFFIETYKLIGLFAMQGFWNLDKINRAELAREGKGTRAARIKTARGA